MDGLIYASAIDFLQKESILSLNNKQKKVNK